MPLMALPDRRFALQALAHAEEAEIVLDEIGKRRPMREQRFMREAKQRAGAAAIGNEEAARDQPVGELDLARIAQRVATDRACGRGFLLLVGIDQREEKPGQRLEQSRREIGDELFGFARDRAFEPAERVINIEQERLVVLAAALLKERLQSELQQGQRARLMPRGFEKVAEIAILALLQRQPGGAHRSVDDVADIRRAGRLHIEAAALFLEAQEGRIALELGIEIIAQRRDDPNPASARERIHELDDRGAIFRAERKDLFELIENQQQSHFRRAIELLAAANRFPGALQGARDGADSRFRRPAKQHRQRFRARVIALCQLRQGIGREKRASKPVDRIVRQMPRADDAIAPFVDIVDRSAAHQPGQDAGADQRRFADAAHAEGDQEGAAADRAGLQPRCDPADCRKRFPHARPRTAQDCGKASL